MDAIEEEAEAGNLTGAEVFVCTDNDVFEKCYAKGSSSNPLLLDVIIRLRALAVKFSMIVHILHISGLRMIAIGVDGLSRGMLNEGVMTGKSNLLSFLPLAKSALEVAPELLDWFRGWIGKIWLL